MWLLLLVGSISSLATTVAWYTAAIRALKILDTAQRSSNICTKCSSALDADAQDSSWDKPIPYWPND